MADEEKENKRDLPIELGTCACCIWENRDKLNSTYVTLSIGRYRIPLCKECFRDSFMIMSDFIINEAKKGKW